MLTKSTLNDIYSNVSKFMLENFNFNFDIPFNINYHLPTAVAQVVFPNPRIEISGIIVNSSYVNIEAFTEVLEHEAIHYYLWSLKQPFQDGTVAFESLLKQKKLPSTHFKDSPVTNTLLFINNNKNVYINRYI